MSLGELVSHVVAALEESGVDYLIGGSIASMSYGEPRLTLDLDILADLREEHIARLQARFPEDEYYFDEVMIRNEIARQGQFNIIHPATGLKVDIFIVQDTPYARSQLARRRRAPLSSGGYAYFAQPEDIILMKLVYYREGGSEKHLRDINGILAHCGDELDRAYLATWSPELGVADLWRDVEQTSGGTPNQPPPDR